jgi:hypothetical protein
MNILGPVGDIVSEWILKGAFIKETNFGSYDFSAQDPTEITLTLAMDYCLLNY